MREMNKFIFYTNLMATIYEIVDAKNVDEKSIRIKIIPVYERDKSFTGTDDLMRLVFLSKENITDIGVLKPVPLRKYYISRMEI